MSKTLVLAEKPSVGRDIARVLKFIKKKYELGISLLYFVSGVGGYG